MPAGIKFYSAQLNIMKGAFDFTDDSTCTLKLAFTNTLPLRTYTQLSDLTQISYTNMSARVITGVGLTNTLGVVKMAASPLTITASGTVPAWQYPVLYDDDTTGDLLIGYWDVVEPVIMTTGQNYLFNIVSGQMGQLI